VDGKRGEEREEEEERAREGGDGDGGGNRVIAPIPCAWAQSHHLSIPPPLASLLCPVLVP
jgi:hypothetical protein